jgi:hypothetical protein
MSTVIYRIEARVKVGRKRFKAERTDNLAGLTLLQARAIGLQMRDQLEAEHPDYSESECVIEYNTFYSISGGNT